MAEGAGGELDVDAGGGVGEEPGAQAGEQRLGQHDGDEADGEDVEGGPGAMGQDLVDHDLEEERADQGQELEEKGRGQHRAEQAAEAHDRGDEPGEVEGAAVAGDGGAGGEEDQPAGPAVGESESIPPTWFFSRCRAYSENRL